MFSAGLFNEAVCPTLCGKYYVDACVKLNTCTVCAALAPHRVLHVLFLISLVLRANVQRLGNTEHSNVNENSECYSK